MLDIRRAGRRPSSPKVTDMVVSDGFFLSKYSTTVWCGKERFVAMRPPAPQPGNDTTINESVPAKAVIFLETLAARGLEEHVRITLIFSRIISFMLFMCYARVCTFFEEFLTS